MKTGLWLFSWVFCFYTNSYAIGTESSGGGGSEAVRIFTAEATRVLRFWSRYMPPQDIQIVRNAFAKTDVKSVDAITDSDGRAQPTYYGWVKPNPNKSSKKKYILELKEDWWVSKFNDKKSITNDVGHELYRLAELETGSKGRFNDDNYIRTHEKPAVPSRERFTFGDMLGPNGTLFDEAYEAFTKSTKVVGPNQLQVTVTSIDRSWCSYHPAQGDCPPLLRDIAVAYCQTVGLTIDPAFVELSHETYVLKEWIDITTNQPLKQTRHKAVGICHKGRRR